MWRGPMATNALRQMIRQTLWGPLDFLLIDLPPGTGDVHLSIISEMSITGAIVVSTPQKVALADVVRGIAMFRNDKIDIPVLGLVENMAWFTPAELPENRYYLFGKEGVKMLAERQKLPLLAQIPLIQSVRESGDAGRRSLQRPTLRANTTTCWQIISFANCPNPAVDDNFSAFYLHSFVFQCDECVSKMLIIC